MTRVLFIGDIMGKPGRQAARAGIEQIRADGRYDLIIANAENAAGGFGLTERIARQLLDLGIAVLSGGNHTFDKKEILGLLDTESRILRPHNYPPGVPGSGIWVGRTEAGVRVALLNLMGRVFMHDLDDPFRAADEAIESIKGEFDLLIVDFHAEATSEKVAFGWHLDGRAAAVVGTHTHVQTADERILPGGTAFITDVGMTGPQDSVIGVRVEEALARFRTGIPNRFQVARGPALFSAVTLVLDEGTGLAESIHRHHDLINVDRHPGEEDDE